MRHKISADLKYPSLWRGCVFAAAPALGQTGSTLQDNSRFRNNATQTNMEAADWTVKNGSNCLEFGGTNEYARVASNMPAWVSCAVWINPPVVSTTSQFILESYSFAATNGLQIALRTTGLFAFEGRPNEGTYRRVESTSQVPASQWTLIGGQLAGSTMEAWLNGKREATLACTPGAQPWTRSDLNIGGNSANDDSAASANFLTASIAEIRLYDRILSSQDWRLLATRIGIAYETAQRRSYKAASAAAFRPAWASQRTQMIGGGNR